MLSKEFHKVRICGIACAVPKHKVATDSFRDRFGDDAVDRFKNVIGIENRYLSDEKQTASDLCCVAARQLMEHKGWSGNDIDALVFITQSPDYTKPSTAFVLQSRLKIKQDCIAFDVNLGCSAFVNGIHLVSCLIESGAAQKALLLIGDAGINQEPSEDEKSFQIMFGDAGSAILMEQGDDLIRTMIRSNGDDFRTMITPVPGTRFRSLSPSDYGNLKKRMNGEDTFLFSITKVPRLFREYYDTFGCSSDDFDYIILHQANLMILKQIMKRLKLTEDKVPVSIGEYGNTDGVSNPITIVDLCEKLPPNQPLRIIASGFGIGLSWGIAGFTINTDDVLPIIHTDEYFEEGMHL